MADRFGIEPIANTALQTTAMQQFYDESMSSHDTVGAVAIDAAGNLATATSTSGSPTKPAGRVGDSPLYGSGGYALNGVGACGATGFGENIMRLFVAKEACELLATALSPQKAAEQMMQIADTRFENSMIGLIMLDPLGTPAVAHTTPKIAVGWSDTKGVIRTAMHAAEFQEFNM